MQIKKGIQLAIMAILFLGVAAYIVYAIILATKPNKEVKCTEIACNIEESSNAGFITSQSIEKDLKNAGIYPIGRPMNEIQTKAIENLLKSNEFIGSVECYKTANGKVAIDLKQRTPVMYVMPKNGKSYYVDNHGNILANKCYPANILVATGSISTSYASKQLSRLGSYILADDFWNSQIVQLAVSINSEGESVIQLVPRVGEQSIHLGTIDNFEKKLQRLKTFYENAITSVGWNKYQDINLEYKDQVICTKQ